MRAFEFFEVFLISSRPRFFEVQSNDSLATALVLTHGHNIASEKIVFQDQVATDHHVPQAVLKALTPEKKLMDCIERRQGGGEWVLEIAGVQAARGGILFHYNRPYGDLYMEVNESFRRRGLGAFLVQQLKRECYKLGAIPCARCSPANIASRRTLQRAGFVPFAHILIGSIVPVRRRAA